DSLMHWYLDALDPRAGFAFVSMRAPDLLSAGGMMNDGPAYFVGPPGFVPEVVGTRAIGFAMARNRGQMGLFTPEGELSFDSLIAVAEFVRRVYLRGGSGDSPNENGAAAPPPVPEGGGLLLDVEGMPPVDTNART